MPSRKRMQQHKKIYGGGASNVDELAEDFASSAVINKPGDIADTPTMSAIQQPKYSREELERKFKI